MAATNNVKKSMEEFKKFMCASYPEYLLVLQADNTLSYKKDIPAKSANCATAGCLLLLGVIPGIIYFLISSKNAEVKTLNVAFSDNAAPQVTGDDSYKILTSYANYQGKKLDKN